MHIQAFVILALGAVTQARSIALEKRALDTGSCGAATIDFGIQDRTENSFQATNQADFNHGSALAIGVIANFICGQLASSCKAPAATNTACKSAISAASGQTGQAAADAFNAIIGGSAAKARRATSSLAGADFGTCTPTMDFVAGRAGRKATEFTFQATDAQISTGQQDALNPAIIANRICDQLTNVCGANAAAKAACKSAQAGATAKVAATADTFNAALGF